MSRSDKRRLAIQRGEQMPTFSEQGTDRTDEARSKHLFDKLKRDGDCWHELKDRVWIPKCKHCGISLPDIRMDFFNPPEDKEWEYFGWIRDRISADKHCHFFDWLNYNYQHPFENIDSCVSLAEALETWFKEEDN